MKNIFAVSFMLLVMSTNFLFAQTNTFPATGSAGIGTTNPNASSMLDIVSTTKGVLFPRMTKAQRNAIVSPANGLVIYQTNSSPGIYFYNNGWTSVSAKGADKQLDNLSDSTSINTNLLPNATKAFNLGSGAHGWNNIYFGGGVYFGSNKVLDFFGIGNTLVGNTGNTTNIGSNNTYVGTSAGHTNSTGVSNTATGAYALQNATSDNNTAVGTGALTATSTGQNNTSLGYNAGATNSTGRYNTYIGYSADATINNLNNSTAIGANAVVTASNNFVFGSSSITGWGFGGSPGLYAIKVGSLGSNGNGAYLTPGGAWTSTSARSKKEDFQKIEPASILSKINQLEVTKWKYKGTENEYHYGPMAEDFYSLFSVGDNEGISEVDKSGVLFLGVQALIQENMEMKDHIQQAAEENQDLKDRISKLEALVSGSVNNDGVARIAFDPSAVLGQNIPNPFDNSSLIPFRIPKDCKDASIVIIESGTGKVAEVIPIACNETHISIDAGTLPNGNYSYTLYVDGKVIDTKQMVLAK